MNKIYQRIDWENYPSSATPLNEDNLNKMDYTIDKLDDRIVTHETTKLDTATGNSLVKDVTFDETTGIFTIEKLSGSKITINTALEKISTNFHFNPTTQKLVLTLIDGTVQEIDLSALITQYEFSESDTITFEIDASGKVKANILNGSITGEKLEPNYLADVTLQANNAKTSAYNAKTSEELAYQYAEEARESASQAQVNNAANITYDNSISGLEATNVKDALDEVAQGSDSALKDGDGNVITETYAKKSIYGDESISLGRKADTTVGAKSFAQGHNVTASGGYSSALGYGTTASNACSYAEGYGTVSDAPRSHAEGEDTKAHGRCSHTEGTQTIASGENQHVQGKYNVEDTQNKYAHIVGGGDATTRKNIHTLDWQGNAEFAGDVKAHDANGNEFSLVNHTHIVDNALSSTSVNPVQNKVITASLNGKADKSSVLSTLAECTASTTSTDIAGASALSELSDSSKRKFLYIGNDSSGKAILEVSGNVCILQYTNVNFTPNTYVPESYRPRLVNGAWGVVSASMVDAASDYRIQVQNTGLIVLQKNGISVNENISIRGQIIWII